jgi:hypothetical protein
MNSAASGPTISILPSVEASKMPTPSRTALHSRATLVGPARHALFDPIRTTPIHGWAEAHGALFENVAPEGHGGVGRPERRGADPRQGLVELTGDDAERVHVRGLDQGPGLRRLPERRHSQGHQARGARGLPLDRARQAGRPERRGADPRQGLVELTGDDAERVHVRGLALVGRRVMPTNADPTKVRAFVDFQNDVTAKDIKLAVREG